jgi:putative FmdB family regulatory protein
MPLYEYACAKCGHRFERIEKVNSSPVKKCPQCGGRAKRQVAPPAIQFKGSGWYVTDYAHRSAAAEKSEAKETKEAPEAKETKPARETPKKPHKEK